MVLASSWEKEKPNLFWHVITIELKFSEDYPFDLFTPSLHSYSVSN
ncbi:hypothetical protein ETSB_0949 [cyanobacterium endosymbiont of Epithemia turgida isolate EtSB Lake Yunoko]|nr:hypothetical protein ETSB_0949 [cyanobacterium endosymbiont of Epithemia turgida isolate EtSB Lake Yunoko]